MDEKIHIQCRIDKDTFELKPETTVPTRLPESFVISVVFQSCSEISQMKDFKKVVYDIQQKELEVWIDSVSGKIYIKMEKTKDWQRFLNQNFQQFVGLIVVSLITEGKEDFIWVEPSDNEKVWILGMVWNNNIRQWEGMLAERNRIANLDRDFWTNNTKGDISYTKQCARRLFNLLKDEEGLELSDSFPFCSDGLISTQSKHSRRLTIKVNPSELWFLLFPVDYFCRFDGYGSFQLYKEVEWILTPKKSFIQNSRERLLIQNELQNVKNFLKHSVVILNTYPHFENDPSLKEKCCRGTNLVKDTLSLLQDVDIDGEVLSLRWYLNPTKDKIYSELLNPNTRYFFADFHVKDGKWQTGVGKIASWENTTISENLEQFEVEINFLEKESLSHIRLMRTFHCYSVAIADALNIHPTIAPKLLSIGALRVEGSIMEENYLDYLCSLINLFFHSQGLRPIIMGKCFEKGIDFNSILKETNSFLESCNWNVIQIGDSKCFEKGVQQ